MRIDIATLFPQMCEAVLSESIIGRARKNGCVSINCHNIRDYTLDRHNRVDDSPYGGGMGMVMQAQPIYDCYRAVCEAIGKKPHAVYMSPQGKTLTQEKARELSELDDLFILCGHYEGVDERVIEEIIDEEISVGDYVVTGGELPAMILTDSIVRMLDGVLSSAECFELESHYDGFLEYPQYTRPEIWNDKPVPPVLLSGHHKNIGEWRREQSVIRTLKKRPDIFNKERLTAAEIQMLSDLKLK